MVIDVSLYTTTVKENSPMTSTRMGLEFLPDFFSKPNKCFDFVFTAKPQFTYLNLKDSSSTEVKWWSSAFSELTEISPQPPPQMVFLLQRLELRKV